MFVKKTKVDPDVRSQRDCESGPTLRGWAKRDSPKDEEITK